MSIYGVNSQYADIRIAVCTYICKWTFTVYDITVTQLCMYFYRDNTIMTTKISEVLCIIYSRPSVIRSSVYFSFSKAFG